MIKKELQKLRRVELLEMIVKVLEENEILHAQICTLKKQLEDRNIAIDKSGSIAEAALKISGVLEATQKAADIYLENIKIKSCTQN